MVADTENTDLEIAQTTIEYQDLVINSIVGRIDQAIDLLEEMAMDEEASPEGCERIIKVLQDGE